MDVAGLAKLVYAGLSGGLFNNDPEFSIAHGRINKKLGRSVVIHLFEQLCIDSVVVDVMLLDGDNRASFYHLLVRVGLESNFLILVHKGNNMITEHIGTRGLVCSMEGFKIFSNVCEGLLGV